MPRFGVSIYSISRKIISKEITPEQAVEWLAGQGAEAIELVPFGFDLVGKPDLVDRLLTISNQVNVPITNYSTSANFLQLTDVKYEEEMIRVNAHIDVAASLGLKTMRLDCSSNRRPFETNTVEIFQQEMPSIIKAYERLCDYAKQYNITILMENHGFHVNGSERIRQVLTGVKRDNFGHQLDVGNYICVDDPPEIAVRKTLPFATTIHMKDFYIRPYDRDPGDAPQFECSGSWFKSINGTNLRGAIFGQGDLDVYGILKSIKLSGYNGDFYIEYEGREDCEYGTKVSLDNLKRIYQEV